MDRVSQTDTRGKGDVAMQLSVEAQGICDDMPETEAKRLNDDGEYD